MKTLNNFLALQFPVWQMEQRGIDYAGLNRMTPSEQYKLNEEMQNLPRRKKMTRDKWGNKVEIGAYACNYLDMQDILNSDDLLDQLKDYYVVLIDKADIKEDKL